jgi:hypothetical protein
MKFPTVGAAVRDWRGWIDGQRSDEPDSQMLIRIIYSLWIVAFLLKHAGSAWDIAWHFRYVFGAFEPPHLVNVAGTALATTLVVFHTITGRAADRTGLYVLQGGFIVFLISVPLDLLNHFLFGLDVTVWSPTHLLTFASTAVMLIGVIFSWLKLAEPGAWRLLIGLACWAFLLDDMLFQLGQQEYGVIAVDAYIRGQTTASPELLAQAGRNPEQFVQGGIPAWIYPVWLILTSTLVLAVARRTQGWRWTATVVALLYLGYRVVGYLLLNAADFPQSFIPVMLLGGAFVIDVSENRRWHPLASAAALSAAFYLSGELIERAVLMPEFALGTAPFTFVVLWACLAGMRWWWQRRAEKIAVQIA